MELSFSPQVQVEIDYSSAKPEGFNYDSRYIKNVMVLYKITLHKRDWGMSLFFMCPDQEIRFDADLEELSSEELDNCHSFRIQIENIEVDLNNRELSSQINPESLSLLITEIKNENGVFVGKAKGTLVF